MAVGAAAGATAGQLALRRLPGNPAEWMIVGAVFGVVVVVLGFGSALVACGLKLPSWTATLVGGVLVAWSGADAFDTRGRVPTAPASIAGRLAFEVEAVGDRRRYLRCGDQAWRRGRGSRAPMSPCG